MVSGEIKSIHAIQSCPIYARVVNVGTRLVSIDNGPRSLFMAAHVPRTWRGASSPSADDPITASASSAVGLYVSLATTCTSTYLIVTCRSLQCAPRPCLLLHTSVSRSTHGESVLRPDETNRAAQRGK